MYATRNPIVLTAKRREALSEVIFEERALIMDILIFIRVILQHSYEY